MATKKRPEKKTVRAKRKKTINAKIKLQDWWLLCCLNTPESIRSAYSNNLRMCVYACEDVCVYVCVCVHVHAGTLLYRSITWASDCAISPVSPLCSPRRLILPGGMVLMWEAGRRGRRAGEGGWLHTLSVWEQLRPHGRNPLSPLCWLQHLTFGPNNLAISFVHWILDNCSVW